MARATNAFQDEPTGKVERARGGFYRNAQGTPYVSDPSGATVKSGERKGQPKRLAYGSPSGAGKQIENSFNLQKWSERRGLLGLGREPRLWVDLLDLAQLDPDTDEAKELADTIWVRARAAAEANLSADRGTHGHALTEDHDEERDWIERAKAGEDLGLPVDVQTALVGAWDAMLERDGLEILAVEASCVDDTWRLAGTLDRIARTTRPLRFARFGGEVVEIPAGTVLVLDVKTGKHRVDSRGVVQYWQAYAVQIASYAQSRPYDTETEQRGDWPWSIDQDHALIAHLDVLGALAGEPSCTLVHVDLIAGRDHGGACVQQAKAWERRDDVFSIAQLIDDAEGIEASPADAKPCTAAPTVTADPGTASPESANHAGEEPARGTEPASEEGLVTGAFGPAATTGQSPTPEAATGTSSRTIDPATSPAESTEGADVHPPAASAPSAPSQLLADAQARMAIDAEHAQPAAAAPTPADFDPPTPGEGEDLGGEHYASGWDALQQRFKALPRPALDWCGQLIREAREAGVGFQAGEHRTARRFDLYRGVIALADREPSDDALRALVALALDTDAALFPAVPAGKALGALDADGARRFADLVDAYLAVPARLVAHVNEAGLFVLAEAVAA